ncbi:MAG TPA: cation diffusion facilitator family transporter, partial [Nevskiaceae bacterium]
FEGILVVVAAGLIIAEAVRRLLAPRGLEAIGAGLSVAVVAGLINLAVARVLLRAGRRHGSVALTADGRHLMTDVWTTVGVVVGVALAAATGWRWVDPLVALLVALQVLRTGVSLIHESAMGLMDAAWPARDRARLAAILDEFRHAHAPEQIDFHAVRTRRSANRRFVALHILVPGSWTVREAHDLAERVEQRIVHVFPNAIAFTHVEPLEDPRSYDAQALDRRL